MANLIADPTKYLDDDVDSNMADGMTSDRDGGDDTAV